MSRFTLAALTLTLAAASMSEACDRAYRSYSYRPTYRAYSVSSYAAPRVHRACPYPMTHETWVLFRQHPVLIEKFPQEAALLQARFGAPAAPGGFAAPTGGPAAPVPFAAGPQPGQPTGGLPAGGLPTQFSAPPSLPTSQGPSQPVADEIDQPLPPADGNVAVLP